MVKVSFIVYSIEHLLCTVVIDLYYLNRSVLSVTRMCVIYYLGFFYNIIYVSEFYVMNIVIDLVIIIFTLLKCYTKSVCVE